MAYESDYGTIVDVEAVDNEINTANDEMDTTIDDVDMAYDAAEELDEVHEALEAMKVGNPPPYAVKMVHDRLRHINARTGLAISGESLEDTSTSSLSSSVASKAKAVWKWIIDAIAKAGEFIGSVWDKLISLGSRVVNGSKQAKEAAKAIPKNIDEPMKEKDASGATSVRKKSSRVITPPSNKARKPLEDTGETPSSPMEFEKTYRQHVLDTVEKNDVFGRAMAKLSYSGKAGGLDFNSPLETIPNTLQVANNAYQFIVDLEREMSKTQIDDLMNVGLLDLTNRAAGNAEATRRLRSEAANRLAEKIERIELDNLKKYTPFYAPDGSSLIFNDAGAEFIPSSVRSPDLAVVRKSVGEDWAKLFFDGKTVERTIDACTKAVENADKNMRSAQKQLPVAWKKLGDWAFKTGREYSDQAHILEYTKAVVAFSQMVLKKTRMAVSLYGVVITCSSAFVTMSREVTKSFK